MSFFRALPLSPALFRVCLARVIRVASKPTDLLPFRKRAAGGLQECGGVVWCVSGSTCRVCRRVALPLPVTPLVCYIDSK